MKIQNIALIGFGTVGSPLAHKLYKHYKKNFYLVASGNIRKELESQKVTINGDEFDPKIISTYDEIENGRLDLLIVCVKNYDLLTAMSDIKNVVSKDTLIFPLQNGIYSYDLFCREFSENVVVQGYIQGPNTERQGNVIKYINSGEIHIGSDRHLCAVEDVYKALYDADVEISREDDIKRSVWKKLMLNVAGNSVTALTGADYSMFKSYIELQTICRQAMLEFLKVAQAENVNLSVEDIEDILNYYISYNGSKKTSMLVDVINERKTENDYLSGKIVEIAAKHKIEIPVIDTLYNLVKIKEKIYLRETL